MQYGHDEAVADGVNVDFDVWRIRTQITESGATIVAAPTDVYVDKRHKLTRAERLEKLQGDLTYTANELDRDVVAEDQIRTVIREFRDRVIPTAFPGRNEVSKTILPTPLAWLSVHPV
jgi:type I restriction enzyme R subunit